MSRKKVTNWESQSETQVASAFKVVLMKKTFLFETISLFVKCLPFDWCFPIPMFDIKSTIINFQLVSFNLKSDNEAYQADYFRLDSIIKIPKSPVDFTHSLLLRDLSGSANIKQIHFTIQCAPAASFVQNCLVRPAKWRLNLPIDDAKERSK